MAERVTVPAKWFKLARLIVDEPVDPKLIVKDVLEAEMLKSCTLTATVVEDEIPPDVPVTVIVALPGPDPTI